MPDQTTARHVRKTAEKAALDALAGDMVAVIGDLAVATADVSSATDAVSVAAMRAQELVAAATREGEALVAAAGAGVDEALDIYARNWARAKAAGWSPAQLRSMGYDQPKKRPRKVVPAAVTTDSAAGQPSDARDDEQLSA